MATDQRLLIESKAPTRIDLAGGTVDIWPIYLFLKQATTLNLGIDLYAEAKVEATPGEGKITLRSGDQHSDLSFGWDELDQMSAPPSLELHTKLLRHFARERKNAGLLDTRQNITLSTVARSPSGAGLGGSSTLSIAMIGALATWARSTDDKSYTLNPLQDGEKFIEIVRDVETTVIQVPAGMQDYYGAMYGGLQSLKWGAGTHSREWLSEDILKNVNDRLLLFYSGQSRNSGINNWALFKAFIDKQGPVRDQFAQITQATLQLEHALRARDWKEAGRAIHAEWDVRHTLAPGISTSEMDKAFALAMQEGASAGKICGAGGGGCFFVYFDEANEALKNKVRDKITALGIRHLPFQAVPRGLEVRVTRA